MMRNGMGNKEVRLKVSTLNCWGLPLYQSQLVNERFRLIGQHFAACDRDVLMFQEVWRQADYQSLIGDLHSVFPYYHYFFSGVYGTGCCIFSKWPIQDVFMHKFSLNGYIHKLSHLDFLAGACLNGVVIEKDGLRVAVLITHLHAEYDEDNDEYLAHRVAQAYELSEVIRWAHLSFDGVILGGDLNLQPKNFGYKLILANAGLKDAWIEASVKESDPDNEAGNTCDLRSNTWVARKDLVKRPKGQRIDHIMFREGNGNFRMSCASCRVFAGKGRVPDLIGGNGQPRFISFSDHEGVQAELVVSSRAKDSDENDPRNDEKLIGLLEESIRAFRRGIDKVFYDRIFCLAIIAVALFVVQFPLLQRILDTHLSSFMEWYRQFMAQYKAFHTAPSPLGSGIIGAYIWRYVQPTMDYIWQALFSIEPFNLDTWGGFIVHTTLLIVIFACAVHAFIISTIERRTLMGHMNNIKLRLRNLA